MNFKFIYNLFYELKCIASSNFSFLWPDDGLVIEPETCCHPITLKKINIYNTSCVLTYKNFTPYLYNLCIIFFSHLSLKICDELKLTHGTEHCVSSPSGYKNVSSLSLRHQVKTCDLLCYIAMANLIALRRRFGN